VSAPVFLVAPAVLASPAPGSVLFLDGEEGRHAVTVRRLAVGEPVDLVDGLGRRATGSVVAVRGRDVLEVEVSSYADEPAPSPRLVVVQALPKGERGETAVETLTEVGVDEVVPWAAARCVAVWRGEKAGRGVEKWRRTAAEAGKQARRARFPVVTELASTADVVTRVRAASLAVVLHESASRALASVPVPASGEVVLVVGPEGGLEQAEFSALADAGALACRLGPSVLRTSTAGTVAAAVVLASTGRWA